MVQGALNLCGKGGIKSPFASLLLFVVRISIRVRSFCVDKDDKLYQELCENVLSRRVRRKLRVWLRKAHEEAAIADSLKIHAHLALLPNSTMESFMCSASYVVLWHSRPEITRKRESVEDVRSSRDDDPLAIITNAIAPGKTNKSTSKMISFATPVRVWCCLSREH